MNSDTDYLKQKILNVNNQLSVLLDNIDPLKARHDLIELLEIAAWKANFLLSHFKEVENNLK